MCVRAHTQTHTHAHTHTQSKHTAQSDSLLRPTVLNINQGLNSSSVQRDSVMHKLLSACIYTQLKFFSPLHPVPLDAWV